MSWVLLVLVCLGFLLLWRRRDRQLAEASEVIRAMLDGQTQRRLDCLDEGAVSRLFHDINSLAAVLCAHADSEAEAKAFLKTSIQDISHQLKTPLSSLSIYQELLQDEGLDSESRQHFVTLSGRELERMEALVQNLLKLTKLDAHTVRLERKTLPLLPLLEETRERFSVRAEQEGKTLQVESCAEETAIFCDPMWFSEALDNLVKNALDHTGTGDSVTLRGSARWVQVEDTGRGIPQEDIYYIFKRFYRSRFSSDKSGIGLGLSLVKAIAEQHGGSVEVESRVGKGSRFTIFLP